MSKRMKVVMVIVGVVVLVVAAMLLVGAGCIKRNYVMRQSCELVNNDWEVVLEETLPYLGHRNWILVVDKAYPAQSGAGIEVIYTGESLLDTLESVVDSLENSDHIAPIFYTDLEMDFMSEALMPGTDVYRAGLKEILAGQNALSILHNDVFPKIDEAAKLFKILVLKTNETVAYSSVFIELDCGYWGPVNEAKLRESMK